MKNQKKADAFRAQLRRLEKAERMNGKCYGYIVTDTAKMVALSVLKKLCDTGAHIDIMNGLRRDIMSGTGEGMDLVQEAALAILNETEKAHERHGETLPEAWTEETYTVKKLDKRVIIREADSAKWTERKTCAITEAFRAVREAVQKSRGVQLASLRYSYYEDMATDTTGAEEALYHRALKYSTAIDDDGTMTGATNDYITEKVKEMNLTEKQNSVLTLRLKGYGQKAIASYTGVSKTAVQKTAGQIQKKAIAIGLATGTEAAFMVLHDRIEKTAPEAVQTAPEAVQTAPEKYIDNDTTPERMRRIQCAAIARNMSAARKAEKMQAEAEKMQAVYDEMYAKMK